MPSFDKPLPTEINGPIQAVLGNPSGKPVAQMISSRGDYAPAPPTQRPVAAPVVERAIVSPVAEVVEVEPVVAPVPVAVFHSTPAPVAVPETPETIAPQVASLVEDVEEVAVSSKPPTPKKPKMSEQQPIVNNYYGAPGHHGHHGHPGCEAPVYHLGAQPYAVAPQPLVVQQAPAAGYAVETAKVSGTDLTKGVLRIGADSYDLTGAVLGSLEFQAQFISMLTNILSRDLNVQAALLTPKEREQDVAIAALGSALVSNSEAIRSEMNGSDSKLKAGFDALDAKIKKAFGCAYYEEGFLVIPGFFADCEKPLKIDIRQPKSPEKPDPALDFNIVNGELAVGTSRIIIPFQQIANNTFVAAFKNMLAAKLLPNVEETKKIAGMPVATTDKCDPLAYATTAQLTEVILTKGIPQICQEGKLVPVAEPTSLLSFGASCLEFGVTKLENLMLAMSKFLPLAPKGVFPVELRGYGLGGGLGEQRYPVTVRNYAPLNAGGAISGSGTNSFSTSAVSVVAPESGLYAITSQIDGFFYPDTDAVLSKGFLSRFTQILVGDGAVARNGGEAYFDTSNQMHFLNSNTFAIVYLPAGSVVKTLVTVSGGGKTRFEDTTASLSLVFIGSSAISINP